MTIPLYAQVAIATPLHQLFSYRIPEYLADTIKPGMRLVVPFRNKKTIGFCMGLTKEPPKDFDEKKIKTVLEIKDDFEIFSPKMLELLAWLSDYYLAPIGEVCQTAVPSKLLKMDGSNTTPRLKEEEHSDFHQAALTLTEEQQKALGEMKKNWIPVGACPVLLHGITGSGKTEVYLQLIKKVLQKGKQAILLVPEIGLTPQLIGRVQSRLEVPVAIYHSGLTDAWRLVYWEKMRKGEINVVVGTRSALFAPFRNLGMIIVDEEHDSSYKQAEGGFYYHARDAAIVRGKLEDAKVILGSATPSLESFYNAKKGKYQYICLSKRATGALLPSVELIDLRQEKFVEGSRTLSNPMKEAISENLYRGEQSLLLLNRRGFANFLLCEDCGKALECPNCSISLTYHKNPPSLVCHYCDTKIAPPETCPLCQSSAIKPLGEGTQSLEEELKKNFPDAGIFRLDRDTATKREDRHAILKAMKSGKIDILIGTQMVAKGHDFPNVTLVGVILADTHLHLPDFRSHEKTFQLLTQVAGRSGRGAKAGRVLVQTFHPEDVSLLCAKNHDFEAFSQQELMTRETLLYPPFSRLAQIRIQGGDPKKTEIAARELKKYLSAILPRGEKERVTLLGPAKAPLFKIRNKYRWHLLLKTGDVKIMKHFLKQAQKFGKENCPPQVQLQIDIDCLNMM